MAVAGLNILQPDIVTATITPLNLRPSLRPPTVFGVARARLPVSVFIGQMLTTLSSTETAPAKEAVYAPLPEGRISNVARFPRFVPTKQQMLE